MKTSTVVWIIVAVVVIGGGIWWFTSYKNNGAYSAPMQPYTSTNTGTPAASTTTTTTTTTTMVPGNNLTIGQNSTATLGNFLAAYNGMTLYTYAPDTTNVSNCTGTCAAAWPPYIVAPAAKLVAESPINGTLGTIKRSDTGALQVTYNGHPLYFYKGDTAPNDTNGQGIGGVWFVVKP